MTHKLAEDGGRILAQLCAFLPSESYFAVNGVHRYLFHPRLLQLVQQALHFPWCMHEVRDSVDDHYSKQTTRRKNQHHSIMI